MKLVIGGVVALAAITFIPLAHADPGGDQAGLSQPFSVVGGPYVGQ
jgi:hypothetical protein